VIFPENYPTTTISSTLYHLITTRQLEALVKANVKPKLVRYPVLSIASMKAILDDFRRQIAWLNAQELPTCHLRRILESDELRFIFHRAYEEIFGVIPDCKFRQILNWLTLQRETMEAETGDVYYPNPDPSEVPTPKKLRETGAAILPPPPTPAEATQATPPPEPPAPSKQLPTLMEYIQEVIDKTDDAIPLSLSPQDLIKTLEHAYTNIIRHGVRMETNGYDIDHSEIIKGSRDTGVVLSSVQRKHLREWLEKASLLNRGEYRSGNRLWIINPKVAELMGLQDRRPVPTPPIPPLKPRPQPVEVDLSTVKEGSLLSRFVKPRYKPAA
jgi:hypothetical protein